MKKKGVEAQRVKPYTPTRAVDAFIGEEEQNGKQERRKGNIEQLHFVASCDPQGS